ncbi:5-(carboxyamino)imidazole ribonucleotide synthase [Candidatus Providencia siddallii]|uniref:N5-carboxyaminoimidazole ribonucleotide synthase n=1 Tax=Candidatus Providencia siddallii TaxID=1715285 RepID=A0ABM9NPE1_9GAMM
MKSIYVIGDGQLGRMLKQAGEPLGIKVFLIGLNSNLDFTSYKQTIITNEIEHWSNTSLIEKLYKHNSFINNHILKYLTDRCSQKKIFDSLKLSTANWSLLKSPKQLNELFLKLGNFLIIKIRTGGYNGKGQIHISSKKKTNIPTELYGKCIVEQKIKFDSEISIIGARNKNNKTVFYPITYNLHKNGILQASVAFPKQNNFLQKQAQTMLKTIMDELNYIGVMTMECFVVNNKLLINEIAPRVHNSGHWTQNGASISQFELHLRSILNLPIFSPEVNNPAVIINLIGINININWLSLPLIHLHWYEKKIFPNRKVGHLNLSHYKSDFFISNLNSLINLLPKSYKKTIDWIKNKLQLYFNN